MFPPLASNQEYHVLDSLPVEVVPYLVGAQMMDNSIGAF